MKYSDDVKELAQLCFSRKMSDEDIDDYLAFMRQSGDLAKEKKQQIIGDISDVVLRQPELKKILHAGNTAQLQPSEKRFIPASELKDTKKNWKFLPTGPGDIGGYVQAVEKHIRNVVDSVCRKKFCLLENKDDFNVDLKIFEHAIVYTPYTFFCDASGNKLLRNLVTGALHDTSKEPYVDIASNMVRFASNYDKVPLENSFVDVPKLSSEDDVFFYPTYALDADFYVSDLLVQCPKIQIPDDIKKPLVTDPVYIKKLFSGGIDKKIKARFECFMNARNGVAKNSQQNLSNLIFSFDHIRLDESVSNVDNLAFPFENKDAYANSAALDRHILAYTLLSGASSFFTGGIASYVLFSNSLLTTISAIAGGVIGAGVAFATRNCVSSEENQKLNYLMSVNAALKQSKKLYVPFNLNQI